MRKDSVAIKDDLLLQLYRLGKELDRPITALVDEFIRDGLKRRNQRETHHQGGAMIVVIVVTALATLLLRLISF